MVNIRKTTLDDGVAVLKPVFERMIELIPKQAQDRLFPHGITLIEAKVNLTAASFELKIQGPDGKPSAQTSQGEPSLGGVSAARGA